MCTDMTAEEALQQAEAEGLTLERSDGVAGFRGVTIKSRKLENLSLAQDRGHIRTKHRILVTAQ